MYTVYVIKSNSAGNIYIGYTNNLQRRLHDHNSKYSKATKRYCDWILIYKEEYPNRLLAMRRERYLKSGDGKKILKSKVVI